MARNASLKIERCRSCGSRDLEPVLSLGDIPLANDLVPAERLGKKDRLFPLRIAFCTGCRLVQLEYTVPPEELFSHYLYRTSVSSTMRRHFQGLAQTIRSEWAMDPGDLVVEIGSNDGCMLRNLTDRRILGIEPAANLAEMARAAGVPTWLDFFDSRVAQRVRREHGPAKVVVACNVMAHVPEISEFVTSVAELLAPDGVFIAEFPYFGSLVNNNQYDTIYHEHVFYFSLIAVSNALTRFGLSIFDVQKIETHGGSLRTFAARSDHAPAARPSLGKLLAEELADDACSLSGLQEFAERVSRHRRELPEHLQRLRSQGTRVSGYGASAKGTVLLNACGIDQSLVQYVVDKNDLKRGRYVPGVRIPVLGVDALESDPPDVILLLVGNIAREIIAQERDYLANGGRFLVPLPGIEEVTYQG